MKRLVAIVTLVFLLSGCSSKDAQMDRVLALRSKVLQSKGCTFDAVITADYGKELCEFTLSCTADEKGNVQFTVKEPAGIAGITGSISAQGGKLTFDDKAVAFELLADGQFSPVSSPWLFVKTLRGGYIASCGKDGDHLLATIHDSYKDDALVLDIWFGAEDIPIRAEILWKDRRFLSMEVKNFRYL